MAAAAHAVEGVLARPRGCVGLADAAAGVVVAAEAVGLERQPPEAVADAQAELATGAEAGVAGRAALLGADAGVAGRGELAAEVDLDVEPS